MAWITLAVLCLFYFLNSIDRGILSLVVAPVKHDLHITDFQISLLLGAAYAVFYAICGLPFGWLADRIPRRPILYAGVTFWSLSAMAGGLAHSFTQLLLARVALGFGESTLGPCAHSIIADRFPKDRMATALSIYTFGSILGTGGAIALGGLVVGYFSHFSVVHVPILGLDTRPWQAVFLCIGAPGLLLAFLAFAFKEPVRVNRRAAGEGAALGAFLKSRWPLLLCFVGAFSVASMLPYGINGWTPTYMYRAFGWTAGKAGPVVGTLNFVACGIGTVGGGYLTDRLSARGIADSHLRVMFGSMLVALPAGVAAFLVKDPILFLALLTTLALTGFSFVGYAAAAVQAVTPPELRGRMAALFLMSLGLVGASTGPVVIAAFTDFVLHDPQKLGLSMALAVAVVAPVSLLSCWLGMSRMREAVAAVHAAPAESLVADPITAP